MSFLSLRHSHMLHEDLHGVSGGNLVHLSCNGRLAGSPRQTPDGDPIRRAPSTSLFRKMSQMISRAIQKILLRYLERHKSKGGTKDGLALC